MQRLNSKINFDVLEKLFDDSVCASPTPKFLQNSIIPAFNFQFYSDVNSFSKVSFLYWKKSSVFALTGKNISRMFGIGGGWRSLAFEMLLCVIFGYSRNGRKLNNEN